MFFNDAFDVEFDRQHRPERPIPSGQIHPRTVWLLGGLLIGLGWLCFLVLGAGPALWASALAVAIVLYDAVHKHTALAPILMCGCRFLLYLVAASAVPLAPGASVLWRAVALAGYVAGLSFWARGSAAVWPVLLLLWPLAVALWVGSWGTLTLVVWLVLAGWMVWCLRGAYRRNRRDFGRGVAGLLAGIVLVDWLAAAGSGPVVVFPVLFALALLLQRVAPAT
jgi:4-hydroxybenzoate polyprenyltransferase